MPAASGRHVIGGLDGHCSQLLNAVAARSLFKVSETTGRPYGSEHSILVRFRNLCRSLRSGSGSRDTKTADSLRFACAVPRSFPKRNSPELGLLSRPVA